MRQLSMIYICIPVHNEDRTIGILLWKTREVMRDFDRDYQVLLFDDASTDATAAVAERYRTFLPLEILGADAPLGYGQAQESLLREAVSRARYPKRDVAVMLQGDFTEDPEHVTPLVKRIEGGADVVSSVEEEGESGVRPAGMRIVRWLASLFLRRLYRDAPVSDPLSSLRAYRIIVLKKALAPRWDRGPEASRRPEQDRWSANLRLLVDVARHARRIEEIPCGLRSGLRRRGSRFRAATALRGRFHLRQVRWASAGREAAR